MEPVHVALVDDETTALKLFEIKFKKEIRSGEVILDTFDEPKKLLEFLEDKKNHTSVVILLSDINMPEMDGFEVLERVKSNYPEIKVFMESAYEQKDYIEKAESLGADLYFTKPLDFQKVKEAIFLHGREAA